MISILLMRLRVEFRFQVLPVLRIGRIALEPVNGQDGNERKQRDQTAQSRGWRRATSDTATMMIPDKTP